MHGRHGPSNVDFHSAFGDAHRGGNLAFPQTEVEPQHEDCSLPLRELSQGRHDLGSIQFNDGAVLSARRVWLTLGRVPVDDDTTPDH